MKKRKVVLLAAGIACLAMALTACKASVDSPSTVTEAVNSSDSPDSGTKEPKILTYALGGELDNLTTKIMNSQNPGAQRLVYETLVNYEDGEIKPCLAESWEWNEDNTILTLHLRKGVQFHDGEPFNAEAVKVNLDSSITNPNMAFVKGVSTITGIETPDESTVVIHYQSPYFGILADLSQPDVCGMFSPRTLSQKDNTLTGTVGTGPYIYSEFVKGDHTKFIRNETYWGDAPYYDEVIVKYIPETASRLKALQTGEIDMIFGSTLLTYDDYKQGESLDGMKGEIAKNDERTRNIVVNASSSLCSDLAVRKAIAMSIDKTAISQGLTYGYETIADTLFPKGAAHTDFKLNQSWNYDLESAKKILDDAGWILNETTGVREKDGKALNLIFTYDEAADINADIATAVRSQLSGIGINVETKGMEQMLWWQEDYKGNFDLTIWNTNAAAVVPQTYYTPWLDSSAGMAAVSTLPEKEEIYASINEYLTSADETRVNEIFKSLINLDNDNVIDIPLTYTKEKIIYNGKKISGYDFYGYTEFFDIAKLH